MAAPPSVLAVLGYHKIGPPPPDGWESWFYIPESTFERHLTILERGGWQMVDVAALVRALDDPASLPSRAALLTFDDAYRSLLDTAAPLLHRRGYPAVVFVPTAFVGGTNEFDRDVEPREAICDWEALRALAQLGVSPQSHSATHRAFSSLTAGEQRQELTVSRAAIQRHVGRPVELFSFPYGDAGTDAETIRAQLQDTGYRAAVLYGGGLNPWPAADPFRLERLPLGPDTDLAAELTRS